MTTADSCLMECDAEEPAGGGAQNMPVRRMEGGMEVGVCFCLAMSWFCMRRRSGIWQRAAGKRGARRRPSARERRTVGVRRRETYHCLASRCGRRPRAPWGLRRAADGLKRNLELLTCDGLPLQCVVGAHGLAYGAILNQRGARHVVEAQALDGPVKLRRRGVRAVSTGGNA